MPQIIQTNCEELKDYVLNDSWDYLNAKTLAKYIIFHNKPFQNSNNVQPMLWV